uniref:Conotoxin superfamily W n=1 Tax=Conus ermineus TaxID=55423 RepID=A0A346CIY2_CONER|nr:conotoxin precursor superfamily W [Conus ermineus]
MFHLFNGYSFYVLCLCSWFGSFRVTRIRKFVGIVVGQTWWHPLEGKLHHAGSTTKQVLVVSRGLVGGVLRMLDRKRHN